MDVYKTEDEQLEAVRSWWNENGKSALLGIILGLGAIFGWRQWQNHVITQTETASDIYQMALVAAAEGDFQAAMDSARDIIGNYGETGYLAFARMIIAYAAVEQDDYATAEEHLSAALDETDNPTLLHTLRIRLAQVYIADNKPAEALAILDAAQAGPFAPKYHEARGDAYTRQGDTAAARAAYQEAISSSDPSADLSFLNLKLDTAGNR